MLPPGMKKEVFSVNELSNIIKTVLESELFQNIKVRGEIVSKNIKNNNVYLTLIDSESKSVNKANLKVIVFSFYDRNIQEKYEVGDEVVVSGDLSYYPPFGQLSLNAKDLYLYGEGMELIKLRRLQDKLTKEGLFDQRKKRMLPQTISKVGIITSKSGAAYQDILQTLERKMPVPTVLFEAVVQGKEAPKSLIRALNRAYQSDVDVIIFGRGGGSKTDLSCFNDEELVRTLAKSNKVIVTGIGHEIDTSLCDLAADIYCITPTAAADYILPNKEDVINGLVQAKQKLNQRVSHILVEYSYKMMSYTNLIEKFSPLNSINNHFHHLQEMEKRINTIVDNFLLDKSYQNKMSENQLQQKALSLLISRQNDLDKLSYQLEQKSLLNNLPPSYSLVKRGKESITSAKMLKKGDIIELGFKDGIVEAEVKGEKL